MNGRTRTATFTFSASGIVHSGDKIASGQSWTSSSSSGVCCEILLGNPRIHTGRERDRFIIFPALNITLHMLGCMCELAVLLFDDKITKNAL